MIDGLGTHSLGMLPTLHQVNAKRDGRTVRSWPLSGDKAEAERTKRRLETDEAEYKEEVEAEGGDYAPTTYSIFSANADFFA